MPQASQELGEKMRALFGSSVDDTGPMELLRMAGYTLMPGWYWEKPSPDHEPTPDERACAQFLIEEWDFDGIDNG